MTSLIASSCSDWFDVTAPSEIRKDDHFSSVTGFQQSLIGCYIGMTDVHSMVQTSLGLQQKLWHTNSILM